uniref:hypothetical protein n=4 Tax=Ornithobacterium rhinotracheale TaxID=28251 RepID=UPI00129CCD0A|nr:hypothetical protein [Ornithobacterium rhinotracheale]
MNAISDNILLVTLILNLIFMFFVMRVWYKRKNQKVLISPNEAYKLMTKTNEELLKVLEVLLKENHKLAKALLYTTQNNNENNNETNEDDKSSKKTFKDIVRQAEQTIHFDEENGIYSINKP